MRGKQAWIASKNPPLLIGLVLSLLVATASWAVAPRGTSVWRVGCTIWIRFQVAIGPAGVSDADVGRIGNALRECFAQVCYLYCPPGYQGRCDVRTDVDVRKWEDLPPEDRSKYHYVKVRAGNLASEATIRPPNGPSGWGRFSRENSDRAYCHEVLHLSGLDDKYCERLRGAHPPCSTLGDPGRNYCSHPCTGVTIPHGRDRATRPCDGQANDIMSDLGRLGCDHILEIVRKAGLLDCPVAICCRPVGVFDLVEALPADDRIEIRWRLAAGEDCVGFHVLRGAAQEPFERVTPVMVPNDAATLPATFSWVDREVLPDVEYVYGIEAIRADGSSEVWDRRVTARVRGAKPGGFALRLDGRNPFRASDGVAFSYSVPRSGERVIISLYDLRGRRVDRLVDAWAVPGTHSIAWRGAILDELPAGLYLLEMRAGAFRMAERVLLIR
jgi:hypothetical protein